MSRKDHRPKASELFAEADLVFSKKVRFAEAFPEIASLRVDVTETGKVGYGGERKHHFTEQTASHYIDCSNPICYNGGVSLGDHLREMVGERKTDLEFTDICQGDEASPKGRRVYRKCVNFFRGKIAIVYRDEPSDPNAA